jgi:inner membrane protein
MVGMLPDLDLLGPIHRGPTHSLGAAVLVGLAAGVIARHPRPGLAAAAAYATHTLLDWLSADTSAPRGIMALWPLTREYYQAHVSVFDAVWRRHETPDFWAHNIRAVAKEVAILGPPAVVALILYARRRRSGAG